MWQTMRDFCLIRGADDSDAMIEATYVEQADIYLRNTGADEYRRGVPSISKVNKNCKDVRNEEKGIWDEIYGRTIS